jgi:hemolysin D
MNTFGQSAHPMSNRLKSGPGLLAARGLSYATFALVVASVAWCFWTEIDLVVAAPGRLVVRGEPVHISPPEQGVVVEILAKVGQRVQAGDALVRLDSFNYQSESDLLGEEIRTLRVEQARHTEASGDIKAMMESLQKEREAAVEQARLIGRQLERVRALRSEGIASIEEVERNQSQLLTAQSAITHLESEVERSRSAAKDRQQQAAEVLSRIQTMEARRSNLLERVKRMTITATFAGVVSDLAVRRPGLTAVREQPLVTIIPEQEELMARVVIPNRSIREIHPDLSARLTAEAFPKDDFGYLDGTVITVEPDANDTGQYIGWLKLGANRQGRRSFAGNLRPGLQVQAQIIVERRKLIDALLRPLRRVAAEPLSVGMQ